MGLTVLDWNIGGAKYLESNPEMREGWLNKMNDELRDLLREVEPDVVTLQEVVCFGPTRQNAQCILCPDGGGLADYHRNDEVPTVIIK